MFRCPSSIQELQDDSSAICKPYLTIRSHIDPHLEPYYNTLVAPYVKHAQPYVDQINRSVVGPVVDQSTAVYQKHAAPRVDQARQFSQDKWETILKPQIDAAQVQVKKQYDENLAPHVVKASEVTVPYYNAAHENVVGVYNSRLVPVYEASRPYAERGYMIANKAVLETGLPYAQRTLGTASTFVNRTLWPKLMILYGQNVQPQLVKITERLGRYRDGKKLQASMEEVETSQEASSLSSSLESMTAADIATDAAASVEPESLPNDSTNQSLSPEEEKKLIREKIETDLREWHEKFKHAIDKGTEDLGERVEEITNGQVQAQVKNVGESMIVQLEETISSEYAHLKKAINDIVASIPDTSSAENVKLGEEQVSIAIRNAGMSIKNKAQEIRQWKHKFELDTHHLLVDASQSTLAIIDEISNLGLTEIGMRWAWMEGVTYKDWQRYHELRNTFDDWRKVVTTVARDHVGTHRAKAAVDDVESRAMDVAEAAAIELIRLKEVGFWKIQVGDQTDDFSTRVIPAGAAAATNGLKSRFSFITEEVVGTAQGSVESAVSQVTENAADVASSLSSKIVGTEPGVVEQAATKISEVVVGTEPGVVEQAATKISEAVVGTPQPLHESVASVASEKASKLSSEASKVIAGSSTPLTESFSSSISSALSSASSVIVEKPKSLTESAASVASVAGEKGQEVMADASEAILGTSSQGFIASEASKSINSAISAASAAVISSSSTPLTESASSMADSIASDASSSATSVASQVSKVFAGAMADSVPEQKPIFDQSFEDDDSYSDKIQSMVEEAGTRYTELTKAVSEAMFPSTTTQGNVASITSLAASQYSEALEAASRAMYGTQQGTGESISSVASSRFADAVAA